MCNRPAGSYKDMGGLFRNLVPTVELAANALAAAASQPHQSRIRNVDANTSLYRQGVEEHITQVSKTLESPMSTGAPPMGFSETLLSSQRDYITSYSHPVMLEHHSDQSDHSDPSLQDDDSHNHKGHGPRKSSRKKPSPDNPGYTAKHHLRHFVSHHYHDHSHDDLTSTCAKPPGKVDNISAKGGVVTPFPIVLHHMLDSVEDQGLAHVVSWQPHGRAFCVHDSRAFVDQVMPIFFRQTKISSFQRQLNLYGFARLTQNGPDKGAYYSEWFLRGRPDLTSNMHRTRVKGTGVRTSSNPLEEPNFYEMPPIEEGPIDVLIEEIPQKKVKSTKSLSPSSRDLRHSNEMKKASSFDDYFVLPSVKPSTPVPTPTCSSVIQKVGMVSEEMDLEDVDVKDMANFLKDVDLSFEANDTAAIAAMQGMILFDFEEGPVTNATAV